MTADLTAFLERNPVAGEIGGRRTTGRRWCAALLILEGNRLTRAARQRP
jgi:hypothetical protein